MRQRRETRSDVGPFASRGRTSGRFEIRELGRARSPKVSGASYPFRFNNAVELTGTWQDARHFVGHRPWVEDVSRLRSLVLLDLETAHVADARVRHMDLETHDSNLARRAPREAPRVVRPHDPFASREPGADAVRDGGSRIPQVARRAPRSPNRPLP